MLLPRLSYCLKPVKNDQYRLVVLNNDALAVIEKRRGIHPVYLFTYQDKPVKQMCRSVWRKARERASLPQVRIHDLKHTFGQRLRAAGVNVEDRADLLGHRVKGLITTHYSVAEIKNLVEAANKICRSHDSVSATILRKAMMQSSNTKSVDESIAKEVTNSIDKHHKALNGPAKFPQGLSSDL